VVIREQLLGPGTSSGTIRARLESGRLRRPDLGFLIDLATCLPDVEVEDAVNEADRLDLIRTVRLRPALDAEPQQRLGRHRVDFFWPDFGFVVETDSLRHHRTAAEQRST
jgi:hypothetical protein